jgi:hypothetical protein
MNKKQQASFEQHRGVDEFPVIPGMSPEESVKKIAERVGQRPMIGSTIDSPGEVPKTSSTLGQDISVSTAHLPGYSSTNVEATGNHILKGKDGSAAGINYTTRYDKDKDKILLEREAYGETNHPIIRGTVGNYVVPSFIKSQVNKLYPQPNTPEPPDLY